MKYGKGATIESEVEFSRKGWKRKREKIQRPFPSTKGLFVVHEGSTSGLAKDHNGKIERTREEEGEKEEKDEDEKEEGIEGGVTLQLPGKITQINYSKCCS